MNLFDMTLAADLGSCSTRIASERGVSVNETVAALDPDNSSRVLAVGDNARKILGVTKAYPVRGGIANVSLASLLLRRLALEHLGRRSLMGVSLIMATPSGAPDTLRRAALETGDEAGFKRTRLVDSILAGACGAGLDISSYRAQMIVDIGRETLSAAVFANGGVIGRSFSRCGSVTVDRHLTAWFAREHGLLITSRTAERLKKGLDRPAARVSCRDSSGMVTVRQVRCAELREAAEFSIGLMCGNILSVINSVPPDAAADLCDTGVTLMGGGALQYGLADSLQRRLSIPVRVAEGPETACVMGMKQLGEMGEAARMAELGA